ncbi:MAG: cold-shock protein [Treponema sp. GWB1_62_6]|nr:MAG: cold-shock protein [Treponema sp. GWB1_62_6]OHE67383.1 MAG: cold-shock protein [Treponema sp. GWC1_61_84]OHE76217.1 MAG: cold-shock protein [Treponema sp. RIFOXYC1_FULL_61_9]HCM27475.1 cold-shock protein [Treponema sp.]
MTTESSLDFSRFGLSEPVLAALARKGFTAPSSIQALALPRLLSDEGHLVAKARTGTGKTAAFGIPLVERLNTPSNTPRALILTPTRELALQVSQEIRSLAGGAYPRVAAVYGGASIGTQLRDLSRGVEIVVGTPGRVTDHLERGSLDLSAIEWFVLDEADEMLDMGFFEDVEAILSKTNPARRVALFSATMPAPILRIVRRYLGEVDIIEDKAGDEEKPAVDHSYIVLRKEDRLEALRRIMDSTDDFYGLVFCATKLESDELARRLVEAGYPAEAIHGDLSQEARERTLRRFRSRLTTVLVATDVAARGIDVERLTHVINWDLPNDRESYVHRVGRTGRAGRKGIAITFALPMGRGRIVTLSKAIESALGASIERMKVPSVASVMDATRKRVLAATLAAAPALPEDASADVSGDAAEGAPKGDRDVSFGASDPRSVMADELLAALGPRRALEALVSAAFGDRLDPSRYASIAEVPDRPRRDEPFGMREGSGRPYGRPAFGRTSSDEGRGPAPFAERDGQRPGRGAARVYIGVGRHHGASARDVAGLLMRAGGVPGRLVDAVDVRDFCAFATLPEDAARRAVEFARRDPAHPAIRPAAPAGEKHR